MPAAIPASHKDLLTGQVYVTLVTVLPDGQPHGAIVWVTYSEENGIQIATQDNSRKFRNLEANPKATIVALDPQNPGRYMEIRGELESVSRENTVDFIKHMAAKYNRPDFPANENPHRVILNITPNHVHTMG